ncbi:MAG: ATP-binding protein [candidate division Zixibacteria bacterium]|jgi:serine/threonine-protein kinase RsbW|nr:ATP-binding protein [candidate division Zixibacteria bacterium]
MDKPQISGDTIIVPSDTTYLAEVDEFVESKLTAAGVSSSLTADLAISITEIVNNAILHGNKNDPKKLVTVTLKLGQDDVEVSIKDEGQGFEPDSIPSPIDEANLLNQVGRGIFIVRSLMDSVDFRFTSGGTEVILRKKIKE